MWERRDYWAGAEELRLKKRAYQDSTQFEESIVYIVMGTRVSLRSTDVPVSACKPQLPQPRESNSGPRGLSHSRLWRLPPTWQIQVRSTERRTHEMDRVCVGSGLGNEEGSEWVAAYWTARRRMPLGPPLCALDLVNIEQVK